MTYVAISFLVLSVIAAIGAIVYFVRRHNTQLETFASEMGVTEMKSGVSYKSELANHEYRYEYFAGSKNQPPTFKVTVDCTSKGKFHITRESKWDTFFKRLGINVEIQTGDAAFDDAHYIQTNFVAFTKYFFQSDEKRQAVTRLFELEYKTITHDGVSMTATITPFSLAEGSDKVALESAVNELAILAKNPPETYPEARFRETSAWKLMRASVYFVSVLSVCVGLAFMVWAPNAYTPLDGSSVFTGSLKHSVPAFLVFLAASVFMLKGRSSSHYDLITNFFVALIGFPLLGYGATVALNGYLDEAEPRVHQVVILDKRTSKSNKTTRYNVYFESWQERHKRVRIRVRSNEYKRVDTGMAMQVTTSPGKLGYDWLVDYQISDR